MLRKHLLYLTNTQLTARLWHGGRLSHGQCFQQDETGWKALSDYLSINKDAPLYLLMDLIEEDFQRDTIPHVLGVARKNLIKRRLLQLYHDTPFRHAIFQGREKTGRRDDCMLFNAVTNAPLIKPWIDAILAQKVPIAGIFSTALLTASLFNKLHLGKDPVLITTHQSAGLRQSFFHDGYLRFSRLIQLTSQDADEVAHIARQEIAKTRQFLANARLLQRGESLKIVTLDNPDTLQRLQSLGTEPQGTGPETTTSRFMSHEEAARILGMKHLADSHVFDTLFLAMLVRNKPDKHYALLEQSYAFLMWKLRIFLYALSGATVAGCLYWSGTNMLAAIDTDNQLWQLQESTRKSQQLYQGIVDSMPKTAANPHDMKVAVELHRLIAKNTSTPKMLFDSISHALNQLPQLRLNELNWEVDDGQQSSDLAAVTQADAANASGTALAAAIGIPTKPSEIVVLKGDVMPFENDYRTALESVNQFASELMKNKHIQVSIVQLPLDIRSSVALVGQAGDAKERATANFELRISWKS